MRNISTRGIFRKLLYILATFPLIFLFVIAFILNNMKINNDRERNVADNARLAAANLDITLTKILDITNFCATAPELIERVEIDAVASNCGRFASQVGAWVVIIELGELHRQIVNTRVAADRPLPTYSRENEREELIRLEMRSRGSGSPHIADVFHGIMLREPIVTAGQFLQLADGREAMLYVGMPAKTLSEQLSKLEVDGGPVFGLIDSSRDIASYSVGFERLNLTDAPEWINDTIKWGASLELPGPDRLSTTLDFNYVPLQSASDWIVVAFQPISSLENIHTPNSFSSMLILIGILCTAASLWIVSLREEGLRREAVALKDKALAARKNQEKSRLLASLAHDIRSPLISLIGSLELLKDKREPSGKNILPALESAESLLQLVDDILELSFLGSSDMTFHPSPCDLLQLTKSAQNNVQNLADQKGLVVRLKLDPDLPHVVDVDRLRLQQVLINLLTNAIKYTQQGEVILQVRVEDRKSDDITLEFAVIDSGVGLAAEDIPLAMREFGRLERQSDSEQKGSGLGLAIVQRLLTAMGTELCVESVVGQGSRFHFLLTLHAVNAECALSESKPLADFLILYAEDEPVIRQVTTKRLEDAGAKVVTAVDGEDALRLLCDVTPDFLLVDLQMPRLGGVGLIRRLRETSGKVGYPIFVLTSHISGPEAAEARSAGATAVFTKPIQVLALAAAKRARHGNYGKSTPKSSTTLKDDAEQLLDRAVIEDILAYKNRNEALALIAEFNVSIRTDFGAITDAINAQDMHQTAKIAHRAQGLCLVLGAKLVAKIWKDIEVTAAGPIDTATMARLVSELDSALDLTSKALREQCL